ncbi:hypothetical protein ACFWXM_29860, partial [Achromobacter xylosoxidans]|uniref:hypothetical protein n=1 Tax=Alcaligenes xylosoxydans xylosoxydans TaxID=85698 RepID=UPI003765C5A8
FVRGGFVYRGVCFELMGPVAGVPGEGLGAVEVLGWGLVKAGLIVFHYQLVFGGVRMHVLLDRLDGVE